MTRVTLFLAEKVKRKKFCSVMGWKTPSVVAERVKRKKDCMGDGKGKAPSKFSGKG